jgi:TRAP-type uncharacterized transport system substrate-binding protein
MFKFFRWQLLRGLAVLLCVGSIGLFALSYFIPAPPKKIAIGTAFKGGAYELFGNRYKEILARSNVDLTVRLTQGAGENLSLMQDEKSDVQVGIVGGGASNNKLSPDVLSLGRVNYQPFWIFYHSAEVWPDLTYLKGKKVAVGPLGSGTRVVADKLFEISGINPEEGNLLLLPIFGAPAVKALNEGTADAVFFPGAFDSLLVQKLLRTPGIRLMNFPRAEAITRIYPFLVQIKLPAGIIDYANNIPPADTMIIGTTNAVVVRKDLHPQIIALLAEALVEVHKDGHIFQKAGEFPTPTDPEYTMSSTAVEYYKNGPSVLQKYLPLWLTVHAQRAIATLLAVLAIGIPVFGYAPKMVRFLVRERILKLYRRLRIVEGQLATDLTTDQCGTIRTELERIDEAATAMGVPNQYSDLLFELKLHVNLMRARLTTRLAEVPKPIAKASPVYSESGRSTMDSRAASFFEANKAELLAKAKTRLTHLQR